MSATLFLMGSVSLQQTVGERLFQSPARLDCAVNGPRERIETKASRGFHAPRRIIVTALFPTLLCGLTDKFHTLKQTSIGPCTTVVMLRIGSRPCSRSRRPT